MPSTPFPLPIALSPAERKALRARAHHLDPVVMIGEAGLSQAVIAEADRALAAHELIKIRVHGDDRLRRQTVMAEICAALGCEA
ncbi:MAG: YhbY family RNA-binding protein, partial [Burkholderiaceae bacterium]